MNRDIFQHVLENIEDIEGDLRKLHVVLLPDFFVDHIVSISNFEEGLAKIESRVSQGGGNIPDLTQVIQQGGNAANTALALSRLGIQSHLISKTDDIGMCLLEFFLRPHGVDISHVKKGGYLASTVALEFGKNHSNVFLQDVGSVEDFDVHDLTEEDWSLIQSVDIVGVMNWSLNKAGTNLAKNVLSFAKKHGVKTYVDTGDPSPRLEDIPELMDSVLSRGLVDFFSLNENEIRRYSGQQSCKNTEEIIRACNILLEKVHTRLDVHTAVQSYSVSNVENVTVPVEPLEKVFRTTGAGDVWNAGNIFAELVGFYSESRLAFANIIAGCYISKEEALPPTLDELKTFAGKHVRNG